jgi:hypothetical protein
MGRGPEAEPLGTLTRIALAAAVLAAGAVAALLLVGHDARAPGPRPMAPLTVRATIAPPISSFGDRLVARVAVLVDPSLVDSRKVRVLENLSPLTPLAPLRARRSAGAVVVELPVSCLAGACTSDSGTRNVSLPPVRVEAPDRKGGVVRAEASWPTLQVRGRVLSSEVDIRRAPRFRANLALPRVSYGVAPATLASLLDAVAVVFALGGIALLAWRGADWARRPRAAEPGELSRALALARESRLRPAPDRRRALGLVARVLTARDEPLSSPANTLAWSRKQPSRDELSDLVEQVAREVER